MDWIDPRYSVSTEGVSLATTGAKRKKSKAIPQKAKNNGKKPVKVTKVGKLLFTQLEAALAQPLDVWAAAFDHAISRLKWPNGCSAESSFLWSTVMLEQAEVLVRAGMSGSKLASIVSENTATNDKQKAEQLAEVVGLMDQSLETVAFEWLDAADARPYAALGVAALAWHIPEHAQRPASEWLTQWLQAVAERIANVTPDPDESVLCGLVLRCELPLLIGVATAASKRVALAEASKAMDNLAEYLECSEDNSAPWLVHGATYLRAAMASILRCRILANSLGLRKWFPPQQKALAGLLKHAARWSRPNGTHILGAGNPSPRAKGMWEALVKQTRSPKPMVNAMVLSGLIPATKPKQTRDKIRLERLPEVTHFSENASGALMQSDWKHRGARIAVDYSDTEICIEVLGPKGNAVIVGNWTCNVALDGQAQLQLDQWLQTCWFTDDDVDYLELEAKFGQHAKVQRQIILFRSDRLIFVADALLCDEAGNWSLDSRLPLAADAKFESEKKTTEGFIVTESGARLLTLPLFLPEWRRQVLQGGLSQDGDDLLIQSACTGTKRVYAPALISLNNGHAKKPFTWRRLTVGEDLRIVGHDEATAYRAQIGSEQFVFYRTLAPSARRTALGMHTLADFYAGRFDADEGNVDTLVEVEGTGT
jgi:hypothetical protein